MYVRSTDKWMNSFLCMSLSSYYAKKYRRRARKIADMVAVTVPLFRQLLNFSDDVSVRIAPIRTRGGCRYSGRYVHDNHLVEIDYRIKPDLALLILAHELVHAEQFHENRLVSKFDHGLGWAYYWNGTRWNDKSTSYESYLNQPWELEAYERQTKLVEQVCQLIS